VAAYIIERLNSAQSSIQFMAFSFTSDEIAQAMLDRQQAGVNVQGVFENRSANGIGSEFDRLADGGADVWTDGNCYTMHHKVIILDDSTVITGSYNFTQRAEDTNDENLLIIDNPTIAAQYVAEFERVSTQARNPTRCGR
jgi:phosphatidylserine/phosphatidylglycerophosphate/cardiolipin synthase-like enzyme